MRAKSRLPKKQSKILPTVVGIIILIIGLLLGLFMWNIDAEDLLNPEGNTPGEFVVRASEIEEPPPEPKIATVTAYSCVDLLTADQIAMNCPSFRYDPKGRTADGTNPIPYKTMACDPAYMGTVYELEGVGRVKCTDTGGAIVGEGRFDLYVENVGTAMKWGVKQLEYSEI